MYILSLGTLIFFTLFSHTTWGSTPSTISTHKTFFDTISKHCGKAYPGKIVVDNQPSGGFSNKKLIMHVRQCTKTQLFIPFHVGDDASRTWIITDTGSGLSLKHDHRQENGEPDHLTLYGGHTLNAGWNQVQAFPADEYTKALFVRLGIPQSIGNTWHLYVYPETFSYRLTREGRVFQVDFDLTNPVSPPIAPWGYDER